MQVDVVSTTEVLWSGDAASVSVPALEGEIGILAGHQPVLAVLKAGQVRIIPNSADPVSLEVHEGFVSVDEDTVTVVVDNTEHARPLAGER